MLQKFSYAIFLFLLIGLFASNSNTVLGQEWARKMFKEVKHDFGTVAKGSEIEYRFKFQNIYKEDIRVSSVGSSCGCTTVSVTNDNLKTWDTSEIVAKFNTKAFYGHKKATLTVRIDRPYYAEVQLQVQGTIRTDVSFNPGKVDLGSVGMGQTKTKAVTVSQRGRNNWKINSVKSNSDYVDVSMKETHRSFGSSNYEIKVTLKENAPSGFVHGEVTLETNERNKTKIPIPFSGKVVPPVEVSPSTLTLGPFEPGGTLSKKVLVKAKTPFKIVDVKCDDDRFNVTADDVKKPIHFLNVSYSAGKDLKTQLECVLEIETDIKAGGIVKLPVIITIKEE